MVKQTGLASIGSAANNSTLKPFGMRKRFMACSPSSEACATIGTVGSCLTNSAPRAGWVSSPAVRTAIDKKRLASDLNIEAMMRNTLAPGKSGVNLLTLSLLPVAECLAFLSVHLGGL